MQVHFSSEQCVSRGPSALHNVRNWSATNLCSVRSRPDLRLPGRTDAQGHGKAAPDAATARRQLAPTAGIRYSQLVDITASTGIKFEHVSSPEQKFIVTSICGGLAPIDYDHEGWPDIYFTNSSTLDMVLHGVFAGAKNKARTLLD